MLAHLRTRAHAAGLTQGEFDDRIGFAIDQLAEGGFLLPNLDPAAELAKLSEGGKNGEARRQEVAVFADGLKARGDIDEALHQELMSLAPTAAGVQLIEKFREWMGPKGQVAPPVVSDPAAISADKARAKEQRNDPRYESDARFRADTDELIARTYGKS